MCSLDSARSVFFPLFCFLLLLPDFRYDDQELSRALIKEFMHRRHQGGATSKLTSPNSVECTCTWAAVTSASLAHTVVCRQSLHSVRQFSNSETGRL